MVAKKFGRISNVVKAVLILPLTFKCRWTEIFFAYEEKQNIIPVLFPGRGYTGLSADYDTSILSADFWSLESHFPWKRIERASSQSNRKWRQLKCAEEILLRSRTVWHLNWAWKGSHAIKQKEIWDGIQSIFCSNPRNTNWHSSKHLTNTNAFERIFLQTLRKPPSKMQRFWCIHITVPKVTRWSWSETVWKTP